MGWVSVCCFFFSSRRRHTSCSRDWSSDVCSSDLSTGFRWYAPEPPTFWTLLRSVWDAVSLSMFGPGDNPFAWGGATAIRKETFFEIQAPVFWSQTVSDDYALSAAVHAAGLTIAYAPGALTPSRERASARQILSWMRRQLTITRVYRPRLWWPALIAHFFYCGG